MRDFEKNESKKNLSNKDNVFITLVIIINLLLTIIIGFALYNKTQFLREKLALQEIEKKVHKIGKKLEKDKSNLKSDTKEKDEKIKKNQKIVLKTSKDEEFQEKATTIEIKEKESKERNDIKEKALTENKEEIEKKPENIDFTPKPINKEKLIKPIQRKAAIKTPKNQKIHVNKLQTKKVIKIDLIDRYNIDMSKVEAHFGIKDRNFLEQPQKFNEVIIYDQGVSIINLTNYVVHLFLDNLEKFVANYPLDNTPLVTYSEPNKTHMSKYFVVNLDLRIPSKDEIVNPFKSWCKVFNNKTTVPINIFAGIIANQRSSEGDLLAKYNNEIFRIYSNDKKLKTVRARIVNDCISEVGRLLKRKTNKWVYVTTF